MVNPIDFIKSEVSAGIAAGIKVVHIAIVREATIDALSRLTTLDTENAQRYLAAIDAMNGKNTPLT